jgi:hypothetical protein
MPGLGRSGLSDRERRTTQISLRRPASPHLALDRVVKSPDTLPCATPPDKVLIRRRIPCSEDARPGAQVASEYASVCRPADQALEFAAFEHLVDQDAQQEHVADKRVRVAALWGDAFVLGQPISGEPRTSSIQVETDANESAFIMRRTEMRAFTLSSASAT